MARGDVRIQVKLVSTAGTGTTYTTTRAGGPGRVAVRRGGARDARAGARTVSPKRNTPERLELRKYDKRTRQVEVFRESR